MTVAMELVQTSNIIRVVGDTYPNRDAIKRLGYSWNPAGRFWQRQVALRNRDQFIAVMEADALALRIPLGGCFLACGERF